MVLVLHSSVNYLSQKCQQSAILAIISWYQILVSWNGGINRYLQAPGKLFAGCLVSNQKNFEGHARSIYQYSDMSPRLSGQTSIFGVVFFVSKFWDQTYFINLQFWPPSRGMFRILINRTWAIDPKVSKNLIARWRFAWQSTAQQKNRDFFSSSDLSPRKL